MAKMTHQYFVVRFKPLQKNEAVRYTCVPNNWILHESLIKDEVTVVYPEENPTLTCARIQNHEQPQKEWKTYEAEVKFTSDSLAEAHHYMDVFNKFFEIRGRRHAETSNGFEYSGHWKKRKYSPQSSLELANHIQDYQNYCEPSETSESVDNVTIQHMRPNPAMIANVSDEDTRVEVKPIQVPCGASQTRKRRILKRKNEQLLSTSENSYCLKRPRSFEGETRQVKSVNLAELLTEMQAKLEDDGLLISRLRMKHIERTDNFNKMVDAINEHIELKHTIPDTFISIELPSPVLITSSTEEEYADEEAEDGSESNEEEKDNQVLKTKRNSSSSKFTLPLEYDPKNSNWTLRYRVYTPNLVELIKSSGVYVNKFNLRNIKRTSRDCKSLARNLMLEIFSDNALKICSLTGARSKSVYSAEVRPGLDEQARRVMLMCVESYGKKMGWCTTDQQALTISLRNKLHEMRMK